jgi:hypothetical protein
MSRFSTDINFPHSGVINAAVGTVFFNDEFLDTPLPLSEVQESGLAERFARSSVLGAINELDTNVLETSGNLVVVSGLADETTVVQGALVLNFLRDVTNTSIIVSDGRSWGVNTLVAVATGNGTINIEKVGSDPKKIIYEGLLPENATISGEAVYPNINDAVNQLNALFSVTAVGQQQGVGVITTVSSGTLIVIESDELAASGTAIQSSGSLVDPNSATARTAEVIDEAGEYFQFDQSLPNDVFIAGLIAASGAAAATSGFTHAFEGFHLAVSSNNSASFDIRAPESAIFGSAMAVSGYSTWRMGLDADRFPYICAVTDTGCTLLTKGSSALPDGQYLHAGWKILSANTSLSGLDNATIHVRPSGSEPVLYYFIESPDGNWTYPLFRHAHEANAYDAANDEGNPAGSTTQIYPDDPSLTAWYLPNNGKTVNSTAGRPSNTADITWNEITTLSDDQFAPAEYDLYSTVTVNEGSSVNLVASPVGVNYTTSISDMQPSGWLLLTGAGTQFQGTAPEVTGFNTVNPSDTYTVTVERANAYGSSFGSFDIVVNNLTAPGVDVSGLTWVSGTVEPVDQDTLEDGSAATFDTVLPSGKRFIIRQPWIEAYVLPQLSEVGDSIYMGVTNDSYVPSSGGFSDDDFLVAIRWDYVSATAHRSNLVGTGATSGNFAQVNSLTDAYFDYAFEADDHGDIYVIACNNLDLNTQPGLDYGGQFARSLEASGIAPHTITVATSGTTMDLAVSDVSLIDIPLAPRWIQVTKPADSNLLFDGSGTYTLNANYTYRFLMAEETWIDDLDTGLVPADILRFTETGSSVEYTTGISRVGAVGTPWAYVEFAVPADVPPLQWYNDASGISTGTGITIAGSTYVAGVSGITDEGPATLVDNTASSSTWHSIDEELAAGERLVLTGSLLQDIATELEVNDIMYFGIKDRPWSNSDTHLNGFENSAFIAVGRNSTQWYIQVYQSSSTFYYFNSLSDLGTNGSAFIEFTTDGNTIRLGASDSTSDDPASTDYNAWSGGKRSTGGSLAFTSSDVMIYYRRQSSGDFDFSEVDWSGLSEINTPALSAQLTTDWDKALDFSGGSERAKVRGSQSFQNPISMGHFGLLAAAPGTAGNTSNDSNARPWATAIVFSIDGNASNQHIWNQGEGAGTTDDNIFCRVDSNNRLYFGWGRSGATNEIHITTLSTNTWTGLYIAHNGTRLSGANASAANLAAAFDIRLVNLQTGTMSSNLSTSGNWSGTNSSTGARMDRSVAGDMTIGGRGANRNFHGKVAAMVVTTLKRNVAMPSTAEISMMVRDPMEWLDSYKIGNSYRYAASASNGTIFAYNDANSMWATNVWLMGDGTSDAYSQIRNQVNPSDVTYTPLDMTSMNSNDIETVTITGLT